MALTLAEAAKLSNDVLLEGVVETIVKDSPILRRLPLVEIVGNGLTYNREATAAGAGFFDVGDTWTESTPTFTQHTATLKIMGGDADIDNFLIATRSNIQDLEAAVIELKAKAVQQLFEQTFITGDEGTDPKQFDGLDELVDPGQSLSMGVNGGSLTLDKLDELIDAVKGGKPDILLMSRRSRRSLNKLARTSGTFLEADRDEFGQMLQFYDGIPIGVSDYQQ
jgi:HK97 family phage major capsid protein